MLSKALGTILVASLLLRGSGQACSQQSKVRGRLTTSGDFFGSAVSISGDTVVAVAPNEDSDVAKDSGAAYVFQRDRDVWRQQTKLVGNESVANVYFGRSVGLSGDTAVISTRSFEGSAYVFVRAQTTWGPLWSEQARLQASDKRGGDEFGRSVAVSGETIVVGAPNGASFANYAGAAYVFVRRGDTWTQQAKLIGTDTARGHYFGDSVGISGATVIAGTSTATFGAVYVFVRNGGIWTQQAKIFRSGAWGGDEYGASIAIYHHTIAVGAPGADDGLTDSGAAYVYVRSGTAWKQQAKVVASNRWQGHRFGRSVSISGYTLAVGAEGTRDQAGNFGGSVYVFAQLGSNWTQQMQVAGTDTVFGDRFASSVSVSGKYLAAGAPREDQAGTGAGAAYLLRCVTTTTTTPVPSATPGTSRLFSFGTYGPPLPPRTQGVTSEAEKRTPLSAALIVLAASLTCC